MRTKLYPLFWGGFFALFWACAAEPTFEYTSNQSLLVGDLRQKGWYEYSGPLNKSMYIYLELEWAHAPTISLPLEHIKQTAHQVALERPVLGGYYGLFSSPDQSQKLYVILEWNPQVGVVVRLLTNASAVARQFPNTTL